MLTRTSGATALGSLASKVSDFNSLFYTAVTLNHRFTPLLSFLFPMLTVQTKSLPRAEALRRIRLLSGKDLRPLAEQYHATVWKSGYKNKGWAGQVIEFLDFGRGSLFRKSGGKPGVPSGAAPLGWKSAFLT